jgi:hypothetical protein
MCEPFIAETSKFAFLYHASITAAATLIVIMLCVSNRGRDWLSYLDF